MRKLVLFLLLVPMASVAQHCSYDFASVIVVRPHAEGDSSMVDGLRITLLDSLNLPFTNYGHQRSLFRRNTDREACGKHGHGQFQGRRCCFPFAEDNYVLVIPGGLPMEHMAVLVQDERDSKPGDRRAVRFRQHVVPLSAFASYPLCGTYDETVYPAMDGRPPFAPVDIILRPQ